MAMIERSASSVFFDAVAEGNLPATRKYISEHGGCASIDRRCPTAMREAGYDVPTALYLAIKHQHTEIVKLLCFAGADTFSSRMVREEWNALHYATHRAVVARSSSNARVAESCNDVLRALAPFVRQLDVVLVSSSSGATRQGEIGISLGAAPSEPSKIRVAFDFGARCQDIERGFVISFSQMSAAHVALSASCYTSLEDVHMRLAGRGRGVVGGVDVDAHDARGRSALAMALATRGAGDAEEEETEALPLLKLTESELDALAATTALLLAMGASKRDCSTALPRAIRRGDMGLVHFLLQRGAAPHEVSRPTSPLPPVHLAVRCAAAAPTPERLAIFECLLSELSHATGHVDVFADDATQPKSESVLLAAVMRAPSDETAVLLARMLLRAGATVNMVAGARLETAAHVAVRRGFLACVEILASEGLADVDSVRDVEGRSVAEAVLTAPLEVRVRLRQTMVRVRLERAARRGRVQQQQQRGATPTPGGGDGDGGGGGGGGGGMRSNGATATVRRQAHRAVRQLPRLGTPPSPNAPRAPPPLRRIGTATGASQRKATSLFGLETWLCCLDGTAAAAGGDKSSSSEVGPMPTVRRDGGGSTAGAGTGTCCTH